MIAIYDRKGFDCLLEIDATTFSGADLKHCQLHEANLVQVDLSDADLSGADLSNADLRLANLQGANLSGANLSGADLTGALLDGANMTDVIRETYQTPDTGAPAHPANSELNRISVKVE